MSITKPRVRVRTNRHCSISKSRYDLSLQSINIPIRSVDAQRARARSSETERAKLGFAVQWVQRGDGNCPVSADISDTLVLFPK
jgi:hypothetical protein